MTAHQWAGAYVPHSNKKQVVSTLRDILEAGGFSAYDPFPGGTGTPSGISTIIRLFVAPPEENWTRIIGEMPAEMLKLLAEKLDLTILNVWIDANDSRVEAIGTKPLTDFLKPDKTVDDLNRAEKITPVNPVESQVMQGEIGDLAKKYGLQGKQVEKLFQKTTKTLFKKLDAQTGGEATTAQSEAMALLAQQFSWESPPARRVQAIMDCLTVPQNWREPSFKALAAAYPIARLLEINEDAPLLPGDEDLLDKVEYPLDYTPIYYAK